MTKREACMGLLGVFIATASPAAAQRNHDADLYIRASVGPGLARSSIDSGDRSRVFELVGPAIDYNFAIGAVMAPNWILHFTMFGWRIAAPTSPTTGGRVTMWRCACR